MAGKMRATREVAIAMQLWIWRALGANLNYLVMLGSLCNDLRHLYNTDCSWGLEKPSWESLRK